MDLYLSFDPTEVFLFEYQCKLPSGSSKSLEEPTFRHVVEQVWNTELREVIPVNFRASIKETYMVENEVMTVKFMYNPLI